MKRPYTHILSSKSTSLGHDILSGPIYSYPFSLSVKFSSTPAILQLLTVIQGKISKSMPCPCSGSTICRLAELLPTVPAHNSMEPADHGPQFRPYKRNRIIARVFFDALAQE